MYWNNHVHLFMYKAFIKELNKMVGEDAMKKHIEPKKM